MISLPVGSKISGDAGHNCYPDLGATGFKKEDNLTKEVWLLIQEKLKVLKYTVMDCTPWNQKFNTVSGSLGYRTKAANLSNSDLHLCIHFNAGAGNGTECWIDGFGGQAEKYATQICSEISKLGYVNRGVKKGNLFIPKYTKMPCVLVEVAFVDSESDMNRYNGNQIANAIVKAITAQTSSVITPAPIVEKPINPTPLYGITPNAEIINDWFYTRDFLGNTVYGRVEIGDMVEIMQIYPDKGLILVRYPTANGPRAEFIKNISNCIRYLYQDEYQNGSTPESVYADTGLKTKIGELFKYEKGTPLYRRNGRLYIAYNTSKGKNTKCGYVEYNGNFNKL